MGHLRSSREFNKGGRIFVGCDLVRHGTPIPLEPRRQIQGKTQRPTTNRIRLTLLFSVPYLSKDNTLKGP